MHALYIPRDTGATRWTRAGEPRDTAPMIFELPAAPHHFGPDHEAFRAALRSFVEREITPFAAEWDEAGTFPRELDRKSVV